MTWTARQFVDHEDADVYQVWDGWQYANCSTLDLAEKIAAALNAQESQLTRGIYPPITESIEGADEETSGSASEIVSEYSTTDDDIPF
jgi:hypothetical protein